MRAVFGAEITIYNPTDTVIQWCRENMWVENPEYTARVRMNKWLGNTPKRLMLYKRIDGNLILPAGLRSKFNKIPFTEEYPTVKRWTPQVPKNYEPYDYQEVATMSMMQAKYGGILIASAGSGKEVSNDCMIPTLYNGWKRADELVVGEYLINEHGKGTKIRHIYPHEGRDKYKVTLRSGREFICCSEHLLPLTDQVGRSIVAPLQFLLDKGDGESYEYDRQGAAYSIPIAKAVKYQLKKLPLKPYALGVLLGDGCLTEKALTISNNEPDIIERFSSAISRGSGGYRERIVKCHPNNYSYKFKLPKTRIVKNGRYVREYFHTEDIIPELAGLKSHEKYIPKEYLLASYEQRLELLTGLIDTDGYLNYRTKNGRDSLAVTFSTMSDQLAKDVQELCWSLGLKNTVSIDSRDKYINGPAYSIRICTKTKIWSSDKHSAKITDEQLARISYRNYGQDAIAKIEKLENADGRCFTVDNPTGLFLINDYIVTHNTSTALDTIGKLGVKTLWIADTLDLINQAKERFIQFYGKKGVGVTTGGKIDIGERITFATLQTLAKIPIEDYADEWECVIVDEVQIVSGSPTKTTMAQSVLSKLNARLKYGLTATYHRSDGMEKCIWSLIGDIIHEVPESATAKTTMTPTIRRIDTNLEPSDDYLDTDGTLMWARLINYVALDDERNRQIAYDIEHAGNSILVLSDRKEQLERIYENLTDKRFAKIITGSTSKKVREQGIQDMRDGKLRIMLSTFSMSKKGLDIPRLDTLALASPNKDYALITQAVGRSQRVFPQKTQALVLDYVDKNIRYLDRMYKKRCTHYNKLKAVYG